MTEGNEIKDTLNGKDRIGFLLYIGYVFFLIAAVVIVFRILYIQYVYSPNERMVKLFRPKSKEQILIPKRGSIISDNGMLLAMSIPVYQIYMDCSVGKKDFSKISSPEEKVNAKADEEKWLGKAKGLAKGLSKIYGDRSAEEYYTLIFRSRKNNKSYVKIGYPVDYNVLQSLKALPLFCENRNTGGMIVERRDTRQYPYGTLARRTIGYVKDNSCSNGNNHIGIEGKFDKALHGEEGHEWMRVTDNRKLIQNYDSSYVRPQNGKNIRTTLNISIQEIADRALRNQIGENKGIEGGCVIVMDVTTGAIKSMVNLLRDEDGLLNETYNMAIGRNGEPGSVFKTTTLMTAIEDGYITSLDQKIPTNHGKLPNYPVDEHILDYERENKTDEISIIDGFRMSSNYVFRYIATLYYGKQPRKFIDKLHFYKLGERFDLDLDGFQNPKIPSPSDKSWSGTDLGSVAIGYSVMETPLHILTFYNAIAGRGRMMKPYLVESIEENGITDIHYGPTILNSAICSKATADTLFRALAAVTEDGTAKRLKNTKLRVAGKTGTSRIVLDQKYVSGRRSRYEDRFGRKQNQATFVGFFPMECPKYSIICTIYSALSRESFYGGTLPALTVHEIVDNIYATEFIFGGRIGSSAQVPLMRQLGLPQGQASREAVPFVKGMGLKDAVFAIENSGYRCVYRGTGHVVSQNPAAGKRLDPGKEVEIVLN